MAMNFSNNSGLQKKLCPYKEKCYRKNPIHFNEMSHPHLEEIVANQLDTKIQIPDNLEFECPDRTLLINQLNVLQMVLRKEKNNSGSGASVSTKDSNLERTVAPSTRLNKDNTVGRNLKDKIERHKQVMTQRRENKLKEMDDQAGALCKSSIDTMKSHMDAIKEDLNSLEIVKESKKEHYSSQATKRNNSTFNDDQSEQKKSKASCSKYRSDIEECSQSMDESSGSEQSSSSWNQTSLIEAFESRKSAKSREEMRNIAIRTMKQHGFKVSVVEPGQFALKYALSAPYHIFFSRIQKLKETYDQGLSITFPEILDKSLGEIVSSLQINFMVDVGWLCLQYLLAGQSTDMLILFGERVDNEKIGSNITMIPIQLSTPFGCHHTKVMILKYKDNGIRVVVSTANLYVDDWENRTQGLWISPHLPPLPESATYSHGESPTGFRKDLVSYLMKYNLAALTKWICTIRRADFSSVNVFFLASVPGGHRDLHHDSWGHRKLAAVLSKHVTLPPDAPQWPIVAQSSSIGSLGQNCHNWLETDIISSMSKETTSGLKSYPNFYFIYPSLKNYKESFDAQVGSCCLPYGIQTHSKQEWLQSYLYQWKSTHMARDKAMPHIKSYTRFSPDFKRISWFVLTSANLSKSAWGRYKNVHYIMSYEAGVIFVPKFITQSTTFPVEEEDPGVPVFPIPYDIPLTKYGPEDKPFIMDLL